MARGESNFMDFLKGEFGKIHCIGDFLEPRQIAHAVNEGFLAGARA